MATFISLMRYFFPETKTASNFFPPPMHLGSVEVEQSKALVPLISPPSKVGGAPALA
jgi:hypothetical protein